VEVATLGAHSYVIDDVDHEYMGPRPGIADLRKLDYPFHYGPKPLNIPPFSPHPHVEGTTLDAQPYVIEAIEQEYLGLRPWIVDLRKLGHPLSL